MFCWKCGKEIADNSQFCSQCGATIKTMKRKKKVNKKVNKKEFLRKSVLVLVVIAWFILTVIYNVSWWKNFLHKYDGWRFAYGGRWFREKEVYKDCSSAIQELIEGVQGVRGELKSGDTSNFVLDTTLSEYSDDEIDKHGVSLKVYYYKQINPEFYLKYDNIFTHLVKLRYEEDSFIYHGDCLGKTQKEIENFLGGHSFLGEFYPVGAKPSPRAIAEYLINYNPQGKYEKFLEENKEQIMEELSSGVRRKWEGLGLVDFVWGRANKHTNDYYVRSVLNQCNIRDYDGLYNLNEYLNQLNNCLEGVERASSSAKKDFHKYVGQVIVCVVADILWLVVGISFFVHNKKKRKKIAVAEVQEEEQIINPEP